MKDYNQATKSDMPLDSNINTATKSPAKKTSTNSKIKVIGNKRSTTSSTKNTSKSSSKTSQSTSSSLRNKLTKDDNINNKNLEMLNEEKIKSNSSFRGRRNQVIIILLSLLLVVSIVGIVIYSQLTQLTSNCFLHIAKPDGVNAEYIVDNKAFSDFRAPAEVKGDRTLVVDIDLKIHTEGVYKVSFYIECYQGDTLLDNTIIYYPNRDIFEYNSINNSYESYENISGQQTISLCRGVVLDSQYEYTLTGNNFRMDVYTIIEKV